MWRRYVLEHALPSDDGASGGDAAPANDVVAAPSGDSAASSTDDKASAPAFKSALAVGADADDAGAEAAPVGEDGRPDWCPEKYWDAEAKAPDVDKLGKGYGELVKLLGNVAERPPKDAGGYKLELAENEEFSVDEGQDAGFREFAHGIGLNNRQYNEILREHVKGVQAGVADFLANHEAETVANLVKEHGTPAAALNVQRAAFKAFQRFSTPEELATIGSMPTTPALINVLSRVAKAMAEDTSPGSQPGVSSWDAQTQEALRLIKDHGKDGAYWNERHPDHVTAIKKVDAWRAECVKRGIDSVAMQREGRA